jgi:catalase
MQMAQPRGRVNYEPTTLSEDSPRESKHVGFRSAPAKASGEKARIRPESFADHYSQARLFYLSQTTHEQAHIASALVFELSKVEHPHIREAIVGHLRHIEERLAQRVADGLGMDEIPNAPVTAVPVMEMKASPALQIIGKMKSTLVGRAVGILIADGSDGGTIDNAKKAVIDGGASVKIIARRLGTTTLADGSEMKVDAQLAGTPSCIFDAVAVILSEAGAQMLAKESAAIDFVRDAFIHLKAIGVDRGGQRLLKCAFVENDAGVCEISDTKAFIAAAKTRQWLREASVRTLA